MNVINRSSHKWIVDECPAADGNWTIRVADGTPNGNVEVEPVATVYGLALAERIVYLHNQAYDSGE